jgi:hypothetical protein
MTAGLLVGGAGSAGAAEWGVWAACHDGDVSFTKAADNYYYPTSSTGRLTTSSNCNDINFRYTNGGSRNVKVCFYPSSGGVDCQDEWKRVDSNWAVIATDVLDGTKYRFRFGLSHEANGQYAD